MRFGLYVWGRESDLYLRICDVHDKTTQAYQDFMSCASSFPSSVLKLADHYGAKWLIRYHFLKRLHESIEWLRLNKSLVVETVLNDGFLECANEWISIGDSFEKKGKTYYINLHDVEIEFPVSREQFISSFKAGIRINCYIDYEEVRFDMLIGTIPDYFCGYLIKVILTFDNAGNYKISSNGLTG